MRFFRDVKFPFCKIYFTEWFYKTLFTAMEIICIYIVSLATEKIQNWEFLKLFFAVAYKRDAYKKGF